MTAALRQAEALLPKMTEQEVDILLGQIFNRRKTEVRGIKKVAGVCGGRACIEVTRIPVWSLVNHRLLGFSEVEILFNFPTLRPDDLKNAWEYYRTYKAEIDFDIRENNE